MSSCVSRVVQPQVESCHLVDTHQVTVEGLVEHIVHANIIIMWSSLGLNRRRSINHYHRPHNTQMKGWSHIYTHIHTHDWCLPYHTRQNLTSHACTHFKVGMESIAESSEAAVPDLVLCIRFIDQSIVLQHVVEQPVHYTCTHTHHKQEISE